MPETASAESVREQLDRILSSAGFVRNERQSRFLRFVVEQQLDGKANQLKESVVGVEVFDRRPDYNTRRDPIVRVEAAKLRARLAEYYAAEDRAAPLIIELPKGGYVPAFRVRGDAGRKRQRSIRLPIALACLAVILGTSGWWWLCHKNQPITIAVLPLEDLSSDPAGHYFADGLTDEIIRNLSVIEGLAVRSRTSSFAFKGRPRNLREAGKQLGVEYIVEGSVLREGPQLRINAQLMRVRDDSPLWSGKFDRKLTDVFAIQDEISRGIVNNLRLKLGGGRRRYEASVEAYDLYLRARALPIRHGLPGYHESIAPFEQAIAKDPAFAPAYAGLAVAYATDAQRFIFLDDLARNSAKMRAAAEKVIQLDPLLAEAHVALAQVYAHDGQWEQSEKSFRRAITLNPNDSTTYVEFVWLLEVLGRNQEALQLLRIAEKTDPLSPEVHYALADTLIALLRYDEAADHCVKLPAEYFFKTRCLARAQIGQGRLDEAIQFLEGGSHGVGFLGYAYARVGRRAEAEKLAGGVSSNPFQQVLTFAGFADKDRTLDALDRMAILGPQRIGTFLNSPELAFLRGDPRVKALRKKVGLPE